MVESLEGPGGDQIEAALGLAHDGELGVHAAPGVQRVAQMHAPDLLRQAVGDQAIEKRLGARTRDARLGERGHVEQTDVRGDVLALVADVLEPPRAPERPVVLPGHALGREPVRPLPAELLAEHRPQRLHALEARRHAQRPPGRALLVRIVDGEDVGVRLLVLLAQIRLGRVVAEAPRVDAQHVDRRLAFCDPLGQLPAGAAGRGDAEAVALVQPEVPQSPGGTDDRAAIRRVRDGAVVHLLHPDLAERRHAVDRRLDVRGQALEVLGEQLVLGILARAVQIAAGRATLVRPEQQAARLLAHVPGAVALAQHAHLGQAVLVPLHDRRMRLGHDVLVLDRDHRDVEPDHGAGLAREVAGRRDDVLARDVALVGPDQPFARGSALDRDHRGLAVDLGAAGARAPRHRLGDVGRLDVAVLGMADRADHALDVAERPELLDLGGRQELDLDPDGLGDAGVLMVLVHAVAVEREADVGALAQADVLPGLGLQALVERDRVLVDLADRVAHVEQRQKAGGVPGRARGQFLALEQHHVRPALLGEVVERRDADRAAADHHHPRLALHRRLPTRSDPRGLRARPLCRSRRRGRVSVGPCAGGVPPASSAPHHSAVLAEASNRCPRAAVPQNHWRLLQGGRPA